MPVYEYECNACGKDFELIQRITAEPGGTCPGCGSEDVRRLISLSSFCLKGTGWYASGYQKTGGKAPSAAASSSGTTSGGGASDSSATSSAAPSPPVTSSAAGSSSGAAGSSTAASSSATA